MPVRFLSDAQREQLSGFPRARRARGESPAKIAKALGVSRASIYRHLAAETAELVGGIGERDKAAEATRRAAWVRCPGSGRIGTAVGVKRRGRPSGSVPLPCAG